MTPREVVHYLVDVVSKNGNLLLNIGPKADGTIPEVMQSCLRRVGEWLRVNGEAIYGSRPWDKYKEGDVRFTRKGNVLYAIALEWLEEELNSSMKVGDNFEGSDFCGTQTLAEDAAWRHRDVGPEIIRDRGPLKVGRWPPPPM
jgi:alpha-L-fucosidase